MDDFMIEDTSECSNADLSQSRPPKLQHSIVRRKSTFQKNLPLKDHTDTSVCISSSSSEEEVNLEAHEIQRMKEQNEQVKRDADLQELEDGAFGGMEGEDAV